MAKDKITEYDATANNNTVCGDVNIAENSALPSDMNNFAREIMSHLKEGLGSGTPLYVDQTNNRVGINKTPTVALDVSGSLSVDGGTIKLDGNYPVGSNNVALGNSALTSITTGIQNTIIGSLAGDNLSDADRNTAVGFQALTSDTLGSRSTAFGFNALSSQNFTSATDSYNVAVGYSAGNNLTTALNTTLIGALAGDAITTGANNVAVGTSALSANTTASNNTAVGYQAGYSNTTGTQNVAVGALALDAHTTGNNTTALGYGALSANTTATGNTGVGAVALVNNTTGASNTAVGLSALENNTTAYSNSVLGQGAGRLITTGSKNTIIGRFNGNQGGLDIRTSSNNIVLSDGDGNVRQWITSDGSVYIGNTTQPNGTSSYGAAFVATTSDRKNLHMATSSTNDLFHIRFYNPNGAVGSIRTSGSSTSYITSSDYRLKENVVDLTGSANRVQQLNPVRFNFIADADKTVDGFLAHEVADIVPEAITGTKDAVDADGNPEYQGIDQSKLVPLLTAALQEALTKIDALEARVAALESN